MIKAMLQYFKQFFNKNNREVIPLQQRMDSYEINGYCNSENVHIVSLKSKQLLQYINNVYKFNDKIVDLTEYNKKLANICCKLYDYYSPNVIYSFNNEIHLCFYHNGTGNLIYGGNQNKIMTTIASYATFVSNNEFSNELLCIYEATIRTFDREYEALNFLIWRQHDCKRNNYTLMYKCKYLDEFLNNTLNIENVKLLDIEKHFKDDVKPVILGNIIKKHIVYRNIDEELVLRKEYNIEHFLLNEKFKETLNKYILNKIA
jgi:hypothetical protein